MKDGTNYLNSTPPKKRILETESTHPIVQNTVVMSLRNITTALFSGKFNV